MVERRHCDAGGLELLIAERARVAADLVGPAHRRLVDLRHDTPATAALVEQDLVAVAIGADLHPRLQLGDGLGIARPLDFVEPLHRPLHAELPPMHESTNLAGRLVQHGFEPESLDVGLVERSELGVRPAAVGEAHRDRLPVRLAATDHWRELRGEVGCDVIPAKPLLEPGGHDVAGALAEFVLPAAVLIAHEVGLARPHERGDPLIGLGRARADAEAEPPHGRGAGARDDVLGLDLEDLIDARQDFGLDAVQRFTRGPNDLIARARGEIDRPDG